MQCEKSQDILVTNSDNDILIYYSFIVINYY